MPVHTWRYCVWITRSRRKIHALPNHVPAHAPRLPPPVADLVVLVGDVELWQGDQVREDVLGHIAILLTLDGSASSEFAQRENLNLNVNVPTQYCNIRCRLF
eukprot:217856_1